jgi:hypothetical protein
LAVRGRLLTAASTVVGGTGVSMAPRTITAAAQRGEARRAKFT